MATIKKLAVGPDFAEAEPEVAARRLNPDGGGADRELDVGMRDQYHRCRIDSESIG